MKFPLLHKLLVLLISVNKPFPFDKLCILPLIVHLLTVDRIRIGKNETILITSLFCLGLISFFLNFPEGSIQIFYPIFFLLGALLCSRSKPDILGLRKLLTINIIVGIIAVVLAFCGIENEFSFSLKEKGLPFIYAPFGLSPTQQVYGTFCALNIWISLEYKKLDWMFYIALMALLLTLNRCSLLFLGILLFIYKKRVFAFLTILGAIVLFYFWKIISSVMFSTETLVSRNVLRKGVQLSYWHSNDWLIYYFGRGNSETTQGIALQTYWGRSYIENGTDFILHCYGLVGLVVILSSVLLFLYWLYKNRFYDFAFLSLFYLILEPQFTHEFLASSFFFFLVILFGIIEKRKSEIIVTRL